jgi:hypothetical protein
MEYIKPLYSHTSLNSWQKANLDYNWYWILTTFFGWCALDQLYLGSPIGFLAKNFVNMNTFGYWYFYDLIRATFDQQSVKFSGPGIPGLGAPGLAAGRFQRPEAPLLPESKSKHKNFFYLYARAVPVRHRRGRLLSSGKQPLGHPSSVLPCIVSLYPCGYHLVGLSNRDLPCLSDVLAGTGVEILRLSQARQRPSLYQYVCPVYHLGPSDHSGNSGCDSRN